MSGTRKIESEKQIRMITEHVKGHISQREAMRLAGEGSQDDACEKYGIRAGRQLRNWIKAYHAHGGFISVRHSGGGSGCF